jgi:hypothetical protein
MLNAIKKKKKVGQSAVSAGTNRSTSADNDQATVFT